ncbi:hypothetical protein ACFVP3_38335 [Streptomyces sp. NPDC057806]|uniref:hypothetical protein n=1 Tax=Streptomyces sp. NPDC057806 TaxID=3346255 RepID=UPI0036BCA69D
MKFLQDAPVRGPFPIRLRSSRLRLEDMMRPVEATREHTRSMLTGWGLPRSVVQDTLVVVSELVTNAELHTEDGPTELFLLQQDGCPLVTVHDRSPVDDGRQVAELHAVDGQVGPRACGRRSPIRPDGAMRGPGPIK